ncbi:hypothetical protein, partial [Xylanibacter rodentium]|uniref:hypothetical protein n=1 Tax=Xylanibacter rodentium TaxID=2736289 RepID=UPI002557DC6E
HHLQADQINLQVIPSLIQASERRRFIVTGDTAGVSGKLNPQALASGGRRLKPTKKPQAPPKIVKLTFHIPLTHNKIKNSHKNNCRNT